MLNSLTGYTDKFIPCKSAHHELEFLTSEDADSLAAASPESQGISSKYIEAFYRSLDSKPDVNPHCLIVMRHGKIITEGYWKPYRSGYPQAVYSLSKSIVSIAVGMAINEGYFKTNDRLMDIYTEKIRSKGRDYNSGITVKHLLTMSAGKKFNELGTLTSSDWMKAFLESEFAFEPGTGFLYNSLNAYVLTALIKMTTGEGLLEFLLPRLFKPLGITVKSWEKCPMGIEKGGWGLGLTTKDMAKIGQLYLQKGLWNGNRLVPEKWIEEATAVQTKKCSGGYGYLTWICPSDGAYQFYGAFGQSIMVIPKQDVVVAMTGGSNRLFPQNTIMKLVNDYFGSQDFCSGKALSPNITDQSSLARLLNSLQIGGIEKFAGAESAGAQPTGKISEYAGTFNLRKTTGSLLPHVIQAVHNDYSKGISSIGLDLSDSEGVVEITECEDKNKVRIGLDGTPRYSDVAVRGEIYTVGSTGVWEKDSKGLDVLNLRITFIESPNTRLIKVIFMRQLIKVEFDELPSLKAAIKTVENLLGGYCENLGSFKKYIIIDIFFSLAEKLVRPTARGTPLKNCVKQRGYHACDAC